MKRFRILLILLALFLSAPALLHAQIIKGELFAGGVASQVDGDECYRYRKFGIHAGAGALVPITNWMDVGLEVLFNQKGAYKGDSLNLHLGPLTGRYDLKLNYVEVPLMLYLTDKDRYSIGIGVSYGRIVGLNERLNGVATDVGLGDGKLHWADESLNDLPEIGFTNDINQLAALVHTAGFADSLSIPMVVANSTTYRNRDISLCADLRVRLWEGIHAELRYQYSLTPIRNRLFYVDQAETTLHPVHPIQLQYNNCITLRMVYIFNEHRSKANKEGMKK